ncbi:MAG: PCMD domain-containing protein [Fibrobacterales bacterium]|nr:PCMD domain-containing protein [Fibrobacterales bacterium]
MKRFPALLSAAALLLLGACEAAYDTFGDSDYNALDDFGYAEQEGTTSVDLEAHLFRSFVTDSVRPDSLTLRSLKKSSLSSVHRVLSKIDGVPADSAERDSLARWVAIAKRPYEKGDRVQLPKSGKIYLVSVSESGRRDLWLSQVEVTLEGGEGEGGGNGGEGGSGGQGGGDKPRPKSGDVSLSVTLVGQVGANVFPGGEGLPDTLAAMVPAGVPLTALEVASVKLGAGAAVEPDPYGVSDFSSPVAFRVTAEDGATKDYLLVAANAPEDFVASPPPRLLSFSSGTNAVTIDTVARTVFVETEYLADLKAVPVSFSLSENATATGLVSGGTADLSRPVVLTVANDMGLTAEYRVQAGCQIPFSDFDSWTSTNRTVMTGHWTVPGSSATFDTLWDNGNQYGVALVGDIILSQRQSSGSRVYAHLETVNKVKLASGNLFTAKMNPKGVGALNMSSYKDGNELIDFGRPFAGRPTAIEFTAKYSPAGQDSCDLYVLLENRGDRNSNVGRSTAQKNYLVASAWYRSTTDHDASLPDVESISEPDADGFRTIRLRLKYGEPLAGSPIFRSAAFATSLENKNGIFNAVTRGDAYADYDVTHIRVVMASSADGNHYNGSAGSALDVDEVRLVYGD